MTIQRLTVVRSTGVLLGAVLAAAWAGVASAHLERPTTFPPGTGNVPVYRTDGPYLIACRPETPVLAAHYPKPLRTTVLRLFAECQQNGFRHLQAAVDAVTARGTRILILPGEYREEPSLEPLSEACSAVARKRIRSYDDQLACPHADNLVAILGDGPDGDAMCDGRLCDLQLEGIGRSPEDVVIDGGFHKLNVIRADRADGLYVRNLTVQRSTFSALYIIETDGFAIDRVLGRWNAEYGFLTFTVDHGLYVDCEAYGNGDSGLYPGSASDLHGTRTAVEINRCRSHHNFLGLAGTAGNSLFVHDSDFYENSLGIGLDSLFPGHPGLPQDSSLFVGNRIWSNNQDYYRYWRDGTCAKPLTERGIERGVVCPGLPAPVGTGVALAGGNANRFEANWIWNNARFGTMQFWAPAILRGETDPALLFDTSHGNRYVANRYGSSPDGAIARNGTDVWWDGEGAGNCWDPSHAVAGLLTGDPQLLPDCSSPSTFHVADPAKVQELLACREWRPWNLTPTGCGWFGPASTSGS